MAKNYDPLHIISRSTDTEGDTAEEYMKKLSKWREEAIQHNIQTLIFWQNLYMQYQTASQATNSPPPPVPTTVPNEPRPRGRSGYYVYTIPSLWKRFAAEVIDFLILFIIKMLLTILLIENFDLVDLDNYSLNGFEERLQNPAIATKITLEIFTLEILHRIIVCFYEAYWIGMERATPGKKVMGLVVIHTDMIVQSSVDADKVLAHPCTNLSLKDALIRAVLKNIFIGLLFPVCFVLLFFKHNRTGYDVLTNGLVVEHNTDPPLLE